MDLNINITIQPKFPEILEKPLMELYSAIEPHMPIFKEMLGQIVKANLDKVKAESNVGKV